MKKILHQRYLVLITGLMLILACSRNDSSPRELEEQFSMAEKESSVEAVIQRVVDQVDREIAMLESNDFNVAPSKGDEPGECKPQISVDTPAGKKFPRTITIDYGEGCLDANKNFRAGHVIVHITGPYWEKNTFRQARLVDYIYNDMKIAGHRHEINKGRNEKGNYIFEVKQLEKVWDETGELISERNLDRTREYNRGEDLKSIEDDELWVTGKARVKINGRVVNREITEALYRKPGECKLPYFQKGIVESYIDNRKTGELNYGDGSCDNKATWTNRDGKETTITLGLWANPYSVKP
ncbi:MAG: hypothetical protein MUD02_11725 [Bacteroidales bacterium]|jgi:hypothetical protein|nr:hypothetical protein [Bacteroidales bacterium]MCU0409607.1 hypothetical protein [Bacteroidales bacterium]